MTFRRIPDGGSRNSDSESSLSVVVVNAIAEHDGRAIQESEPLFEYINPDALDALFAPTWRGTPRQGSVSFRYDSYWVTVNSDRNVTVKPLDELEE
ncbi:HalOD1 output domain-containing protein [Haladaptatus caseinilyticus]|uniref:HalOD1 output domain-containing protein n=1 Tax=Haladaptatus caseinilyticus TaxID=2993314 RepID=UPI00224B2A67|nr:HalOD1 output domain-containing protein [Haladaptatus caseinilyticus]